MQRVVRLVAGVSADDPERDGILFDHGTGTVGATILCFHHCHGDHMLGCRSAEATGPHDCHVELCGRDWIRLAGDVHSRGTKILWDIPGGGRGVSGHCQYSSVGGEQPRIRLKKRHGVSDEEMEWRNDLQC